ncbi:MAG TPA: hypothetical protein VGK10_12905 [Prolixibacteraceae bacterium]|jgi:hypothetical protein
MYQEDNIEPEFLKRPKMKPFRTPDHYFDSIEGRVMESIKSEAKKKTGSGSRKLFQLLKPVLGLAASVTIIYMLAYYPIKYFSTKSLVKSETADTTAHDVMDAYSLNLSLIDENSLVNAIWGDETTTTAAEINPDEVLAYLSTEMTDLEIYSTIQN